ncbi:MAG: site-specific DNA-methyltransferase [bacterium]|nr:site-specific DNA-methyltransferase [bacterium]
MARKPAPPPESYSHEGASRLNQPTVESAPLLSEQDRVPRPFNVERRDTGTAAAEASAPRKERPEPVLCWDRQGATSAADDDHRFAGLPLYTREKVNPLSMIHQLRKPDAAEAAPSLFDDFDGLPDGAFEWEFYQHPGNWQNRLIHGDSSEVMQSLIARDGLAGRVQMIYFDPPYGIGFKSNFMTATDLLETKDDASGVPVGDTTPLRAFRDTYRNGIHSYLDEVHERLVLFRELLTESGSLFVQIGDDNVHRLAVLCDEVFGAENRVATITWRSTTGSSARTLPESASYILWYTRDKNHVKFRQLYETLDRKELLEMWTYAGRVELADGTTRGPTSEERRDPEACLPEAARLYSWVALSSQGASTTGRTCDYVYKGVTYHPGSIRHWCVSTPEEQTRTSGPEAHANGAAESPPGGGDSGVCGLDRLAQLGRLEGTSGSDLRWKWYEDEMPGRRIDNVWPQQRQARNKRYSVQTHQGLVERCILMSTDPGDLVLDPTCGSGVTAHTAERWGRRWITIDAGRVAIAVARRHLLTSTYPWYRTLDGGNDPGAGLDTETMQRVSAATLAYDTVDDPKNTIHLVDRPKEEKGRSRLTGPFTVESHSPYMHLPFSDPAGGWSDDPSDTSGGPSDLGLDPTEDETGAGRPARSSGRARVAASDIGTAAGQDAERLLEALTAGAVRDVNGRELLQVTEVTPWPDGRLVSHEADCARPGREGRLVAAIVLAAPDATVGAAQVAAAAAEARRGRADISDLIVVAPAFENNVPESAGPLTVHKVVASRDLQIPGLARDGGSPTLTLLGEPDVDCETDADGNLVVHLDGFDTYDPVTGELRHSRPDADVDCWMIDTDHDGTAFFPRLIYLPGYKRGDAQIKRLLKAFGRERDTEAAEALCGLSSQPFSAPPPPNNIAVKIITRTGAEMTTTITPPR